MAPRQKPPAPSPGISRIDQESTRTHGYVGRVGYRRTDSGWRPQFTAFFGDRSHGGAIEALRAAEKWLKATKRQAGDGRASAKTGSRGAAKTTTRAGARGGRGAVKKSGARGTTARAAR